MSANEHRRIHMVHSTWVYVRVCVHLLVCVDAYIILLRPCNQWKSQFYVSSTHNQPPITLWKILGTVPRSLCLLRSGRRFLLQMNKPPVNDLSQPFLDSWAPCHGCLPYILNRLGGHFVVFGPCDRLRLQDTSQGVVYITHHLDNLHFSPLLWQMGQKSQKWESVSESFHKTLFGGEMQSQILLKKSVIKSCVLHWENLSVLMYYHSKCSGCGLCLPQLTKERQSSCGTGLMLSFPMRVLLRPDKNDITCWRIGAAPECFFKDR